jgi:hypothetical protein
MTTTIRTFLLLLVATFLCSAATIQFLGPSTGVNDGTDYVGPYNLLVDGNPVEGFCINFNIQVGPPYTWDGSVENISIFTDPMVSSLLEAEYLSHQFSVSPTSDWPGIHHAIWNLFGANYPDASGWLTDASVNYGTLDLNSFSIIVPNVPGYAQSFIIPPTPEPASGLLMLGGMILVVAGKLRR